MWFRFIFNFSLPLQFFDSVVCNGGRSLGNEWKKKQFNLVVKCSERNLLYTLCAHTRKNTNKIYDFFRFIFGKFFFSFACVCVFTVWLPYLSFFGVHAFPLLFMFRSSQTVWISFECLHFKFFFINILLHWCWKIKEIQTIHNQYALLLFNK